MSNGPDTGSRVPQHVVNVVAPGVVVLDADADAVVDVGVMTPSEAGATFVHVPPKSRVEEVREELGVFVLGDEDIVIVSDAVPVAMDDVVTPPMGTDLDEGRRKHVERERAKESIRARVALPEMSESWRESGRVRAILSRSLMEAWFEMPTHVLGELSQEPGLHVTIMQAHHLLEEAARMISQRAGRMNEWLETFKVIAGLSFEMEVWEYAETAVRALNDGPHTESWDSAVEWFTAAWSPLAREFDGGR